jgi:tetratricopeptide (TPR) repeat protein
MKEVVFHVGLCLVAALSAGVAALAQQSSSSPKNAPTLEGRVCDPNGAVISGVKLQLEPEDPGSAGVMAPSASATSDKSGKYVLTAPAPGKYVLRAAEFAFKTLVVKDVTLVASATRQMDLVLEFDNSVIMDPLPKIIPTEPSPIPLLQFSDEPNFAVAGVTDPSNLGLHGSDANVRTSDTLAKETAALRSATSAKGTATPSAGDARRLAGDAREKSGDPVGAVHEYEAAVSLDPSEENYFAWGAELLLHRAGQPAVEVFHKGAEAYPKSARLRAGLGAAYYADGQYADAATEMCKASDLDPGNAQPYRFLGKMEKAAAEPLPCSEEKLARFANEQPTNAWASYYYGLVLWKRARKAQDAAGFAAAEESLKEAAALDPSLGEVYVQLGLLYNARGRRDAALSAFQKAVSASPQLSAAHYQLSLAFRRSGDAAKADHEMKTYEELRRSEDAQLANERRELRQFVTILKDDKPVPK